jgi:NAD+ diphosphatase
MLHDIQLGVFDNAFRQETPNEKSLILFIKDGTVLVKETAYGIAFPVYGELAPQNLSYIYLFSVGGIRYFLAPPVAPQMGYVYRGLMEFRSRRPKHLAFAAAVGCQLSGWYEANRYCGRCGAELAHDARERMMRCERCGNMVYPRISPAVIVGVTDGDRILLTRYSGRLYRRYALIAGFAEIGEPIEDTVRREVLEEVGLKVKHIRYYKSQPWPFSGSLLLGFYCELDGSDEITLDESELECAEWVRRGDIDVEADGISLTNEMIVYFKEH